MKGDVLGLAYGTTVGHQQNRGVRWQHGIGGLQEVVRHVTQDGACLGVRIEPQARHGQHRQDHETNLVDQPRSAGDQHHGQPDHAQPMQDSTLGLHLGGTWKISKVP